MIRKVIIIYLVSLLAFVWGFSVVRYGVFPGSIIASIVTWWKDPVESTSDVAVELPVAKTDSKQLSPDQFSEFSASGDRSYELLQLEGTRERRFQPLLYSNGARQDGFRVLFGAFDFEEAIHGAVLLDSNNVLLHRWLIPADMGESGMESPMRPEGERNPRALEVMPDGSIITSSDNRGAGLFRLGVCGEVEWFSPGQFNDVVQSAQGGGEIWSIENDAIVLLDAHTGQRLRVITLNEIHLANPDVAVFTPRRSLRTSNWYHDPVGTSDVEPLGRGISSQFPGFHEGDLLISYRSLNLVLIIDPNSLEIKWWRTGQSQRQTDVDWGREGILTIYDNNKRDSRVNWDGNLPDDITRYSRVLGLDTVSLESRVLFNGESEKVYSETSGKHQFLPDGNILVTSPDQGRVIEVSPNGEVVFDFLNRFDDDRTLRVSQAIWLPSNYFTENVFSSDSCQEE